MNSPPPLPTAGSGQDDSLGFDLTDGNDNNRQGQSDTPIPSNTAAYRKEEVQPPEVQKSSGICDCICPGFLATLVAILHFMASVLVASNTTNTTGVQSFVVGALTINCLLCFVLIYRQKDTFLTWVAFYTIMCLILMSMLVGAAKDKKSVKVILL